MPPPRGLISSLIQFYAALVTPSPSPPGQNSSVSHHQFQDNVYSLCALRCSVISDSVRGPLSWTWLLCPGDSPGKNTGVGSHFFPPGDLSYPGTKFVSLVSSALADRFFTISARWEALLSLAYPRRPFFSGCPPVPRLGGVLMCTGPSS